MANPPPFPLPPHLAELIAAVYEPLTAHGNATATGGPDDAESGGWDPLINRAHQALGLVLARHHLHVAAGGTPVLCPTCPVCGSEPQFVISVYQAVCGTYGCRALIWNPTVDAAEQLADEQTVKLTPDTDG